MNSFYKTKIAEVLAYQVREFEVASTLQSDPSGVNSNVRSSVNLQ